MVCSPKTGPIIMRVLWDDLNRLKGESSPEEVPIQSGAGRLRPAPGGGGHAGCRGLSQDGHQRADLLPLEEENRKLKQLVADLSPDKQMLQDVLRKKPSSLLR